MPVRRAVVSSSMPMMLEGIVIPVAATMSSPSPRKTKIIAHWSIMMIGKLPDDPG